MQEKNNKQVLDTQKNDTKQKFMDFRKDIRKQQQRDIIAKKRFLNSRSYEIQPMIDMKIDHLTENQNAPKLLSKIKEWVGAPSNIDKLHEYLQAISSDDIYNNHYGIINIRKLLCENKMECIQNIIDNNILPRIIKMARNSSEKHLQLEATWCLANLASGSSEQTYYLIQHNVIDLLVNIASDTFLQIAEQAIWGLGNISGDCYEFRTLVLNSKAPEVLIKVYSDNATNQNITTHIAWVLSNICRIKAEKEPYNIKLYNIIDTLVHMFTNHSHEDILEDCIFGLSPYAKNKYLPIFCKPQFLSKLRNYYLSLFTNWQNNIAKIQAIHLIIGGITSSEDSYADMLMKIGFLHELTSALTVNNDSVLREICWIFSNIAVGTDSQIVALLNEPNLIDKLFELAYSENEAISLEALWTLCNLTKTKSMENIKFLCLKGLVELLHKNITIEMSSKRLLLVLEAVIQLITIYDYNTPEDEQNSFITTMIDTGLAERIEHLQHHPAEIVYSKALDILEKYFDLETDCM